MADEIEKFDPSKLMQGVKDRIKSTFVSLIPDDKWDELVKAEIDAWFKKSTYNNRYNQEVSSFQIVVEQTLNELAKEKVTDVLREYTNTQWKDGKPIINEELKKIITENADKIFAQVIGQMVQNMLTNVRQY
jgi:hypothetical protein